MKRATSDKLDFSLTDIAAILSAWRLDRGPLQQRLANRLRDAIERGDLVVGAQLPPERTLARQLGVSRTTVIGAYDSLCEEGWLESRRGSGTFASAPKAPEGHRTHLLSQLARNPIFSGLIDSPMTTIDFAAASPPAAPQVLAATQFASDDMKAHVAGHGYYTSGVPALRQGLARYLSRWIPTTEDEVLVTTGSQQAISLLATMYVEPGDSVVVETPTYPGALDAFRSVRGRLFGVPVGDHGVRPDDLRLMLSRTRAKLAYVTPSFNNPTGCVTPIESRKELARVAAEFQAVIVEDHVLSELQLDGKEPPPPISASANDSTVVMIGSMSKLFWGGLRVGWLRAPKQVVRRLARVKAVADLATSVVSQLLATRLLASIDEVKAARRESLVAGLNQGSSLLASMLPSWSWKRPAGGLSLWVRLPVGNATDFAEVAIRHGVAIVPGPTFCPDEGCQEYLRLPFCLDAGRLESGIRRLAQAWLAYTPLSTAAHGAGHRAIV
jgi:DNA-binding transcriptional MocR family regulator